MSEEKKEMNFEVDGEFFHYDLKNSKTILEFLESKKIEINSECRDGYCGACRCKLIEGEVEIDEKAIGYVGENEILACSTKPKGNVKISKFIR